MIHVLFSVMAAASIANIVKSSLGPVGLDKMLVDDIGVCTCIYGPRRDKTCLRGFRQSEIQTNLTSYID